VTDRRRWPRYKVAWSVGLFVADGNAIETKAVDASLYGVRLEVSHEAATELLRLGETYRLEVHLPDSQARFVRLGEVRHIGAHGVALKALEALPGCIIRPAQSERHVDDACVATAASPRQPRFRAVLSLLSRLKAVSAARG
jgi:hypothetical protein